MNVLVMVSDIEAANVITFCLEGEFRSKVLLAENSQKAIDLLLDETEVDFIICHHGVSSSKLQKFILSTNAKIPLVLVRAPMEQVSPAFPELNIIGELDYSQLRTGLGTLLKQFMNKGETLEESREHLVRIKTELLLGVGSLKGDVFIRLSSVKYVKLFRRGHVFKPEDLKRYLKDRGIEYLFVKKSDTKEFAEKLVSLIVEKSSSVSLNPQEDIEILGHLFEQVQALSNSLGLSPEVSQIARETVNLTLKSFGSDPKLGDFMKNFEQYSSSYTSSHSLMVANLSVCIAAMMKWPSAGTFQKLIYASLFHDLSIESEDLAKVQTLNELKDKQSHFTLDEVVSYPAHPHQSAEMLSQFKELPPDIDSIILQHHERPDGSGFPVGLNAMAISPISAAFIIAHDVVNEFVSAGSSVGITKYLKEHIEYYSRGNFKEIFKTLREHQGMIKEEDFKRPIAS